MEKATELGVAGIVPVIARRTEKHLAQAAEKRVERWRRIAHGASQQARRADIPADSRTHRACRSRAHAVRPQTRGLCSPSRSAPPHFVTRSRKRSLQPQGTSCRHSKSPSGLKADGLRPRKRSSNRVAGAPYRWGRASSALKPPPSPRWPSSPPVWSDCAVSNRTETRRLATHVEKAARIGDVSAPTGARSAAKDLREPRRRSRQRCNDA